MMMPSLTPASSSSYSSSSSATTRVEKATSEFLTGPDWTLNMDICDTVNYNQLLAKDVVKAVKKRLQHKNPKVQLLSLTLLEALVKNCGDFVHFQIAERNILPEMTKMVKKKADMHVRDRILTLLDSWQEAFGGPGGKYPQYYWAYDELRRSGIEFPQRSYDTAPIFTPPVTHPSPRQPLPGYGMPINSSIRLDEAMATEVENLSLSSINSMCDVADLLADMLQAVNPSDRLAVKDEVIVDLVERCRANQKKLVQSLATIGDEELLARGLELNDSLQSLLARHDAIASGSPLPVPVPHVTPQSSEKSGTSPKADEVRKPSTPDPSPPTPVLAVNKGQVDEDEDEEDDFAQLARRHSKAQPSGSQSNSVVGSEGAASGNVPNTAIPGVSSTLVMSNALVLSDPPAPVRTTKEQDIVELLSLTLSKPLSPRTPEACTPTMTNHVPVSSAGMGNPYNSQAYPGNQSPVTNSYVAPWAKPQAQPQPQTQYQYQPQSQPHLQPEQQFQPQARSQTQLQHQFQPQAQVQTQPQHQFQPQAQVQTQPQHQFQPQAQPQPVYQPQTQTQTQTQLQPQYEHQPQRQTQLQTQQLVQSPVQPQPQTQQQYMHHMSAYPPPPWAPTPGYFSNTSSPYRPYAYSTRQTSATTSMPLQATTHLQHGSSYPSRGSTGSVINGETQYTSNASSATTSGQKPFVLPYRLFEDLNVLGNTDGKVKSPSNSSPSLSEARNQSMIGERRW